MVVGSFWCFEADYKKFWVVSDSFGWFRVVLDGFGWFAVLTENKFYVYMYVCETWFFVRTVNLMLDPWFVLKSSLLEISQKE